jgi:hypothetical protein
MPVISARDKFRRPGRLVLTSALVYFALHETEYAAILLTPDGSQSHVPAEGPSPSSSLIGSNLPSMSASGSFSVLNGAGDDNSYLPLFQGPQS